MTTSLLTAGMLVANRFEIERVGGSGGMGTVFRARDRHTGQLVALKLMHSNRTMTQETERFAREAQVLASLHHPNIVSYIAHGQTSEGQHYLALEWVEGEDLRIRLNRGPLSLGESLTMLRTTATALASAHRKGVIHRDIKPSNLILRNGEVSRVTLIDFGIARRTLPEKPITKTGFSVGTPAYMAPEQTQGGRDITAAADIFALACVMYECLMGEPLYMGEYVLSMSGEMSFEKGPPLRVRYPYISEKLEALLMRMCAEDVAARPPDGSALLEELDAIGDEELRQGDVAVQSQMSQEVAPIALGERRLQTLIVAIPLTNVMEEVQTVELSPHMLQDPLTFVPRATLQRVVRRYGTQGKWLSDGSFMALLTQGSSANDLLRRAADCSLSLRQLWRGAQLGIATGFGESGTSDGNQSLLVRAMDVASAPKSADDTRALSSSVRMDSLSASLLDVFRSTEQAQDVFLLKSERLASGEMRTLCGKTTTCVGRERELGELDAAFTECSEDSTAQAVLILGAAGIGKSRLRHEFLNRLRASGRELTVLTASGDTSDTVASYKLIGQLLRRMVASADGETLEDPETLRDALQLRVMENLKPAQGPAVAQTLVQVCGLAPPTEERGVQTPTTGQGARAAEQVLTQAFIDFLAAENEQKPVLLVIEDLQWADAASLRVIDAALRELKNRPFMVLALGRPEIVQDFPKLWEGRRQQIIELGPLSKRASETLIRQVLSAQVKPATVSRIVGQAAGNALYLEELILLASDDASAPLSEALIAMGQGRLMRLDPEARRILRVASGFGPVFWRGGLTEVMGMSRRSEHVEAWLKVLTEAEIIEPHAESQVPGDEEYGWTQDLLREAAMNLLIDIDRARVCQAAARWLAQVGQSENASAILAAAEHTRA